MMTTEITDYLIPALNAVFGGPGTAGVKEVIRLDKFLGVKEYADYSVGNTYPMADDYKQLLQAFAGPHGKALLKAYIIKHGRQP